MLYPRQAVGLTKSNKNRKFYLKKMSNNELPVIKSILSPYYWSNEIDLVIDNLF